MSERSLYLDESTALPAGAEQRTVPRIPSVLAAAYQESVDVSDTWHPSRLWNLSSGGVAVVVDRPQLAGTILHIRVTLAPGRVVSLPATRIVHVATHGDDLWLVGGEFLDRLSSEQVGRILDDF
jgi:hypothetical protein